MLSKTYSKRMLIFLTVVICISPFISAGPIEDKDIIFTFNLPDSMSSGEWRMYFISIGEFEKSNWSFNDYSDKIKNEYMAFKESCGKGDVFYETIYEMTPEEREHNGCVINGTYQEKYCFKTVSDNPTCTELIPYKINDRNVLDFNTYYDSYMWDINRADFYNHFELSYCNIINDSCTFKIHKKSEPYNPYVVVLENINSTDGIYFSGPTIISEVETFYNESLFACDEPGCDVSIEKKLTVKKFEIIGPNVLIIQFEDWNIIEQESDRSFFRWLKDIGTWIMKTLKIR
ncbi:MAG: hypothetical protein ACP5OA_06665 [Candidatus Woesearchaeota archaeon]